MAFCNNRLVFNLICPALLELTFQLSVYFKCVCKQQRIPLITEPSSIQQSDVRPSLIAKAIGEAAGRQEGAGREGGRREGVRPARRKSEMEQGMQVVSCTGILGSCERLMCNESLIVCLCGGNWGCITNRLALKVFTERWGLVLYCILQFVLGNGQTDVLRTDPNLFSKFTAAP